MTVHTLVSGDGGQIIVSIATTVQGYVKDDPGVWTGDTRALSCPVLPFCNRSRQTPRELLNTLAL